MDIKVRLFAMYREAAGASELSWELAEDATLEDLWRGLREAYPELPEVKPAVAVNMEIAALETPLHAGDEVAFLPPVSGGDRKRQRVPCSE
ncbi:MAG: Molybdopterin synthase sulfur carrier subunit [Anaerolineales bacterium]|nr:Molybdopterin synthase sulfur carrier subunit [Anaerolineales bacterium]